MNHNHEHEWVVFSTALKEIVLMVECAGCHAYGIVRDPSEEEWAKAFHAPRNPYRWLHDDRVVMVSDKPCGGRRQIVRVMERAGEVPCWGHAEMGDERK